MQELKDPDLTEVLQSKEKSKSSQNSDAVGKDTDLIHYITKNKGLAGQLRRTEED